MYDLSFECDIKISINQKKKELDLLQTSYKKACSLSIPFHLNSLFKISSVSFDSRAYNVWDKTSTYLINLKVLFLYT